MRFIPTKIHAAMDYVGGALLIVVPLLWLGAETEATAAIWVPVVIGALMLLQSLITDYEISFANILPVPAHLGVDGLAGLVLAASPWLFGFHEVVWIPHVIIGVLEIGGALTTRLHRDRPAVDRTEAGTAAGTGTRQPSHSPTA